MTSEHEALNRITREIRAVCNLDRSPHDAIVCIDLILAEAAKGRLQLEIASLERLQRRRHGPLAPG